MAHVILCDETGTPQGEADLLEAHRSPGQLHQAFSIFVFKNDGTELLIQQRAAAKPLFAGLWANTCCSHPRGGDLLTEAAVRLQEECGFTCALEPLTSFVYKAADPQGHGTEYEYDTILIGHLVDPVPNPIPNPSEVSALKWITLPDLLTEMDNRPEQFAPWFHLALPMVLDD